MRRAFLSILCAFLALVGFGGAAWYYVNVYSEVKVAPVAVPSSVPQITVPVNPPEPDPSEPATAPTIAVPKNPRGTPVQLVAYRGPTALISMECGPMVRTPRGWSSQCGKVAWKDEADLPRPGVASLNRSLITGHVWCQREVYSLDHLREVKKGDKIEIHYSSGDVVVGVAEQDADSIPKSQLNAEAEGKHNPALHNDKKARTLRLSTCDSESDYRPDGHLSRNVYALYEVTELRFAQ